MGNKLMETIYFTKNTFKKDKKKIKMKNKINHNLNIMYM